MALVLDSTLAAAMAQMMDAIGIPKMPVCSTAFIAPAAALMYICATAIAFWR